MEKEREPLPKQGDNSPIAQERRSQDSSIDQRKPKLHLHRYRSNFFKPLYEIFICYGHEEFFECKEDGEDYLDYASIIENVNRKNSQAVLQTDSDGNGEVLASEYQDTEEEQVLEKNASQGHLAPEDLIKLRKARR